MPTSITNTNQVKTEGTSQTYGQLVSVETGDIESTGDSNGTTVAPSDTVVRIVENEEGGNALAVSDTDRSKIAIAASSEAKEPSVSLDADEQGENTLEGAQVNTSSKMAKNRGRRAIVFGSRYKSKEEVKKALSEARKVDMMISLKSQDSEDVEFVNLKEVQPQGDFTYNFFIPEEEDVLSQEDQAKDPLLSRDIFNVPRYVELKWKPVSATAQLSNDEKGLQERRKLRRNTFGKERGVIGADSRNFKNSFEKYKKKMNLVDKDGVKREVTDIHNLDVAIESTSNKNVFTNTINAVFNVEETENTINSLPVSSKPK